jgi:hypothetical protein
VLRPGADAVQQNDFNHLKLARPAQCAQYMDSPYLYADGTPFPLRANFIELLRDSVDCAVELLRIAERAEGARELRAEAERRSCRALENLSDLEAAVSDAVLGGGPACQRAAERIREAAARAIADEKAVLTQDMVNATAAIDRESSGERAKMLAVLEKLLHKHDLPDTESAIDLELPDDGQRYRGRVLLMTPLDLEALMTLDVPDGHLFAKPLRVAVVCPKLSVELECAGLLSKKARPKRVRLDQYFLTRLAFGAERAVLALRERPDPDSPGFDLVWLPGSRPAVEVRQVLEDGEAAPAPPQSLTPEDVARVQGLSNDLRDAALELCSARGRLEQASMESNSVDAGDASELARRLIALLTPYVRDMAHHAAARDELALKRDIGGGRREEIYVDKAVLIEKIEQLPRSLQQVFDPLELLGNRWPNSQSGMISQTRGLPPPLPIRARAS